MQWFSSQARLYTAHAHLIIDSITDEYKCLQRIQYNNDDEDGAFLFFSVLVWCFVSYKSNIPKET